jgi:CBS domain-containing protein
LIAVALRQPIERALTAAEWKERGEALACAYLELARKQNTLGVAPFEPVIGPYHDRPFTVINADDAVEAARAAIAKTAIGSLPIVGSLDQVSDLTPLLEDASLSQRMMSQLQR